MARRAPRPKESRPQSIAEMKETKLPLRSDIATVVYWPGEGYGGADVCKTMEEARSRVEDLAKLGYGKPGKHPIRIIVTTREIIEFTI